MRMKHSPMVMLIGLAVGLFALWASASPIGVSGDLITGAWGSHYFWADQNGYSWLIICSTSTCAEHMDAVPVYLNCSDGPGESWGNCKGGSFIGAGWNGGSGTTVHAAETWAVCDGPTGSEPGFYYCEWWIGDAAFY